jgi:hypothetical protein
MNREPTPWSQGSSTNTPGEANVPRSRRFFCAPYLTQCSASSAVFQSNSRPAATPWLTSVSGSIPSNTHAVLCRTKTIKALAFTAMCYSMVA